jgi:branched-chain amino acid transport system permease protein
MVVTLAAGIIIPMFIQVVVLPHLGITVAGMRGTSPSVGGRVLKTPEEVFSIIMPFMVALTFLVVNLGRTRIGRILSSIKYNDLASEVLGVNLSFYRLLAFSICCVLAGIGGSLWNCYMPMITLGKFSYMESIWYLGIIIIGGLGSIAGVFMGSIIVRLTEFLVSSRFIPWASGMIYEKAYLPPWLISHLTGVTSLLLSMIILSFLMFAPWGVIHRWERFRIFYRSWPLVREYSGNKKWQ